MDREIEALLAGRRAVLACPDDTLTERALADLDRLIRKREAHLLRLAKLYAKHGTPDRPSWPWMDPRGDYRG